MMSDATADSIRFRPASKADARLLAELNQQLIRDEQHRSAMSLAELEHRMTGFLSADYEATLLESGSDVVGYALYRTEPECLYLRQFFIRPEYRRRGIGRAAVRWLTQHAWRDHARIRLDVLTTNSAAQAFWRAVGFRDYCLTMEFERDGETPSPTTAPAPARPQD